MSYTPGAPPHVWDACASCGVSLVSLIAAAFKVLEVPPVPERQVNALIRWQSNWIVKTDVGPLAERYQPHHAKRGEHRDDHGYHADIPVSLFVGQTGNRQHRDNRATMG